MIRLFIFLAFLLFIEIYSYQAIKTVSNKKIRLTYIFTNTILYFLLFLQIIFYNYEKWEILFKIQWVQRSFFSYNFGLFFTLIISKFIIVSILISEDIIRGIKFLFSKIQNKQVNNSRRKFISNISLAVAAIPIPIMIHGITRGRYNFKVIKHEIDFKDLPKSFDGYTITHLSDFHCGSLQSRSKLKYAIDLVNEQNSDLIAFTGDFVNNTYTEILPWIDEFKKINSKDGKFSVLGNHDYGDYYDWGNEENKKLGFEKLIEIQNELGFKVLRDESILIKKNNEKIRR